MQFELGAGLRKRLKDFKDLAAILDAILNIRPVTHTPDTIINH